MRKGLILLGVPLLMIAGILLVAVGRNPCSREPGGALDAGLFWESLLDGGNREVCDPWVAVATDGTLQSISIIPFSNWTDAPGRPVVFTRSGEISILEPLDLEEQETEILATGKDSDVAQSWLAPMSQVAHFNRITTREFAEVQAELPDDHPFEITDYMDQPVMRCWWRVEDGGGMRLRATYADGTERTILLYSQCGSPAMDRAIDAAWQARNAAFQSLDFDGEHFNDSIATF